MRQIGLLIIMWIMTIQFLLMAARDAANQSPSKPFDIGEYDDEADGVHPNESPYIEIIDGELRVSGIVQACHVIVIAKHFKLI